jgi:hypothetical protein
VQEVSIFDILALPSPTPQHSSSQPAPIQPVARLRLQHAVSALALSDTHLATAHGTEVICVFPNPALTFTCLQASQDVTPAELLIVAARANRKA